MHQAAQVLMPRSTCLSAGRQAAVAAHRPLVAQPWVAQHQPALLHESCTVRPRGSTCTQAAVSSSSSLRTETPPGIRPEPWTGSPMQQQALELLRQRMSQSGQAMPSEDILRWYLRDRSFDVDEAEEKLVKMLTWRKDFQPGSITRSMVAREYASGKAFLHDHTDVYGRPVLVVRAEKHVTGEYNLLDSKRLCVHLIDEAVERLGLEANGNGEGNGVEQIIGIFDLRGFSVPRNADFVFAAFMVQAFFEFYPKRVGQVLFVEAPWVFGPAWEVIRPLMRKYAALVRFVSIKELQQEFFTPATLPAQFR